MRSTHRSIMLAVGLLLSSKAVFAETLAEILALSESPPGVVFEILAGSQQSWKTTSPKLNEAIANLRNRFPDLDIAVVSHGKEQFALTKENSTRFPALHESVIALGEQDVDVHVCGTFASWYEIKPEDFPSYVDVAPSGPAQINQYRALGYLLVDDIGH